MGLQADIKNDHDGDILLEVAQQFGTTLDLDRLLHLVIDRVADLLDAERALFALCNPQGRIERAVVHNFDWQGPGHPLPIANGIISDVIRRRRPVFVNDAIHDSQFQDHPSVRMYQLRLIVAVPIMSRNEVTGILYVDSRAHALGRDHERLDLLTALARLVSTAVENARLFEELQFRAMLLGQLVHDFRSPLTVINTNAWFLRERIAGDSDAVKRIAANIEAGAERMVQMIDSTLELSRIDAGAATSPPAPVDLAAAITQHVAALEIAAHRKNVHVELRPPPTSCPR